MHTDSFPTFRHVIKLKIKQIIWRDTVKEVIFIIVTRATGANLDCPKQTGCMVTLVTATAQLTLSNRTKQMICVPP